ncbi:hypothetical protein SAMN04488005_1656 [Yoonia tamlensis]|uniref:Uncharacterized protein n=1 Tax=Yoonia tamlensis TaxID=390270 RepID=A0A1I6GH96_9RHOB|nr:hypothetical protein [Yoonia tamlensis]SFR41511.1 hypothetical protein SAMN04488005_1656 [Yoonia tamlensis]
MKLGQIAVLSALGALAGCDILDNLADRERQTFVLRPTVQGVHHVAASYTTGVCPFLQRTGTGSALMHDWRDTGGRDRGDVRVGFESTLIPGQDPIPCNTWIHHAYQGKAFFDLAAIPEGSIVETAQLSLMGRRPAIADRTTEAIPCFLDIGEASGLTTSDYDFVSGGADDLISYGPLRPNLSSGDISRTVAKWVREREGDNWLVLSSGPGEAFVEHDGRQATVHCARDISDISITVVALVPPT